MSKNNILGRYRYKWAWIDFQQDGMSKKERIKGKDKRILRKKSQRKLLEDESKVDKCEDNK